MTLPVELDQACRAGNIKRMKEIIRQLEGEKFASLDKNKKNALGVAATLGLMNVVRYLVEEERVPVTLRVVCSAARERKAEVLQYLLQRGKVDINSSKKDYAFPCDTVTPLALALYWIAAESAGALGMAAFEKYGISLEQLQTIKILLMNGADKNHVSVQKVIGYFTDKRLGNPSFLIDEIDKLIANIVARVGKAALLSQSGLWTIRSPRREDDDDTAAPGSSAAPASASLGL